MKAFSQPGCTHLYGLSPVWILHGMRKQERERMSARPLGDWLLNKPLKVTPALPQEWEQYEMDLQDASAAETNQAAVLLTACITQLKMDSFLLGEEGWVTQQPRDRQLTIWYTRKLLQ